MKDDVSKSEEFDEGIKHWESLAQAEDRMVAWEKKIGIIPEKYEDPRYEPAGVHRARLYRRTAESLRMEKETGLWHCACCLKPRKD